MNTLKIKSGLFGFLTLLMLASCNEYEPLLPTTEDKIQGQWVFEKVKFQESFSLLRTDMTSDFEDLSLEFSDDFSLIQTDATTGQELQGNWEIDLEWVGYTENAQFMEVLQGAVANPSTGQTQLLDWENLSVTKDKITAIEYQDGGAYWYTLVRK